MPPLDSLSSSPQKRLQDLVCPHCHHNLEMAGDSLHCQGCNRTFPTRDGIPDFRARDDYWCNVSREKMQELNVNARQTGDWHSAAKALIPQYMGHFDVFDRADLQFLWPCTSQSRILDAGSMWGGLTIPAAQYHKEVFAVDKTKETLEFLKIRSQQMGYSNVVPIACPLKRLPFPDNYFDLAILNGVLEWVAFEQDVVLEDHWEGKRADAQSYPDDPRSMQVAVLRELRRVLRPGGALYLAIEVSIGFKYLLGYPDDHVNLRFVSFLPRWLANVITKWKRNSEYRTYVYSIPGYRSLLRDGGLEPTEEYGALDHYISPCCAVPLDMMARLKNDILGISGRRARLFFSALPDSAMKHLVASTMIIAEKEPERAPNRGAPRILSLLERCGLLEDGTKDMRAVKWQSRSGNALPVNYLIYADHGDKPAYFCKICRDKHATEGIDREAANLRGAQGRLERSDLWKRIPRVLFSGSVDGVPLLVTNFLEGKPAGFQFGRSIKEYLSKDLAGKTKSAVRFLSEFHLHTRSGETEAASCLRPLVEMHRKALADRMQLSEETVALLDAVLEEINAIGDVLVPTVSVHGDFDFFCNILFASDGVQVVDFEHFEPKGLPFLDLGTLIFNSILVSRDYEKQGLPLGALLDSPSVGPLISDWMHEYARLTGLSPELLRLLPPLAALQQQVRSYPTYRDPESFPMRRNRAFQELLRLRLSQL